MDNQENRDKKNKEGWKLWDAIFTSGIFSFLNDAEEARNDDRKFKQILLQALFGIVFGVILFTVILTIMD
ncbi:hypothetical protein E2491_08630 [Jeotgalibacillus sp. R-1-5s-1]|nr:hypothetical protein E2491_08630 [Jeotgalibacillus sp. R-1-5s-1]